METEETELSPEDLAAKQQAAETRDAVISKNRWDYNGESCCEFCGLVMPQNEVTLCRRLPRSRGGAYTEENLIVCCNRCSTQRRNYVPHEWILDVEAMQAEWSWELAKKKRNIIRLRQEIQLLEEKLPRLANIIKNIRHNPALQLEAPKEKTAA
ncbi:HNH endonuclease [Planctomicrobium sp. SH668]|uniref:HNH endonuclease n=1 Tax=Planctomicrobium sp. SH668 TaxID=3448126 RepID=UPI003F5B5EB6